MPGAVRGQPRDSAFGRLFSGPDPRVPSEAPEPSTIDIHLSDLLPAAVREEVERYRWEVPLIVGGVFRHLDPGAPPLIFSAAMTDALAVIRHVDEFDGRSAALRARTLFEHLLNLCDVIESTTNTSKRYMDHRWAVQKLRAKRRDHLQVLARGEARRETRRLDDLAQAARRPLRRAVEAYGERYEFGWAQGSVRQRAKGYGLLDDYDGYSLLSAAIHGSSGSLDGVVRRIDGAIVHRTGHDLELAATAWWEGLAWFYQLMDKIVQRWPNGEAEEIRGATGNLLLDWQKIRDALREQDAKIWPTTAPPGPAIAVVIHPSRVRWFYYRPVDDVVMPVDPPDPIPPRTAARIDIARKLMATFEGGVYAQRPPLIPMPDLRLSPAPGVLASPAAGFWPASTEQWHRFCAELDKHGWSQAGMTGTSEQ
ncbi:DUF5677 domain-containing protein [Cellulosimicrobium sp. 22598]